MGLNIVLTHKAVKGIFKSIFFIDLVNENEILSPADHVHASSLEHIYISFLYSMPSFTIII